MTLKLGAHRSTSGGREKAFDSGQAIGAWCIQIFTSSPRQWRESPLSEADLARWQERRLESSVELVVAHDSYLINLAAGDPDLQARSEAAFLAELQRCQRLGIPFLVTHPGAHVGAGEEAGLERFATSLRGLYLAHPELTVTTLLETTAGQGTSLGASFEQLAWLLAAIDLPERTAVCLDTCHIFAAGYDLRTPAAVVATIDTLDTVIGLDRVKVVHANDSKGDLGSRVDRHEQLGEGKIGEAGFTALIRDQRLAAKPWLVETPDLDRHEENLRKLRRWYRLGPTEEQSGAPAQA